MPKFAANLTMLFNEKAFLGRFEAAALAGFQGIEYLFPYLYPKDQLAALLERHGLKQVLFNLPAGDWNKGERGIACLPDRINEFREGVERALDYAAALGCTRLNCLAGVPPPGVAADRCSATLVDNLRFAAERLEKQGIRLLVEPINTFDIPGFYLHRTIQTLNLFAEIRSDNIFLQYDIYHMQRMEGELAATLKANLARIAHVQIADNPGRHEPGTGEINYPFLFEFIDSIGYDGWIGCEYKPRGTTTEGLGWMRACTGGTASAGNA
jgi:hydroxypyruvate isomerase